MFGFKLSLISIALLRVVVCIYSEVANHQSTQTHFYRVFGISKSSVFEPTGKRAKFICWFLPLFIYEFDVHYFATIFSPFYFPYNTWISWYPGSLSLKDRFSLRFMSLKQIFLSIKQITHCLKPMLRVFKQVSSKHDLVGYLGNLCKINS